MKDQGNSEDYNEKTLALELLTSHLLSGTPSYNFLSALFEEPSGKWSSVDLLCSQTDDYQLLREPSASLDLAVVWLPMPEPEKDDPYAVIVFYCVELVWSSLAVFNRSASFLG